MELLKLVVTLVVCASVALIPSAAGEHDNEGLIIDPRPDQAIKVNQNATFSCSKDNKTIEWTYDNGTKISLINTSRIYFNGGELHVNFVTLNDTGNYICRTTDLALNRTVELRAYEMPTYFMEGMIIVGVNCGLILLFIGCGINSLIQSRRQKRKRREETYRKPAPI